VTDQPKQEPRTEIAGFKLTPDELARLDALIEEHGFRNRSEGLRALVFGAVAFARVFDERDAA
jgi:metal-responsive CopG/Arc/MetJ family transcriptional regulator